MAKNTRETAVQGIQSARTWAAPRIGQGMQGARGWAAPRIERAGHALEHTVDRAGHVLEETVAPKVSGMMTATARRVDPSIGAPSDRRRWLRILAGVALVSALGGIVAAIARKRAANLPGEVMPDDDMTETEPTAESSEGEQIMVEAEIGVNGKGPTS
jgi:RNA 3'-terminal phosphate cyclase